MGSPETSGFWRGLGQRPRKGLFRTLQQLKYVVEVAERGSITEAAKALFIAQPSLSAAVRELEEETGVHAAHLVPCGPGNVLSCEVLTVDGHVKRGAYVSSHLHLNVTYLAVADPAEHVRIKADENSGVKWVGLDEAVALSSEPWIRERIYRKLIEKTRELAPRFATR